MMIGHTFTVSGGGGGGLSSLGQQINCTTLLLTVGSGGLVGLPGTNSKEEFFKIPKLPPNAQNAVLYKKKGFRYWEPVPDQKIIDGNIFVNDPGNGIYQVFATIVNYPYSFGEVYVFPNPVTNKAMLHVEIGQSDVVSTRIYDVAGDLVYQAKIDNEITIVNGKPCYEYPIDPSRFKPGQYIGVVTAEKNGKETIRKRYRFIKN